MKQVKQFLKGFKRGSKYFGNNIAVIINSILLTIVYVIGGGVTSIAAKFRRKRFLETEFKEDEKTYWEDLEVSKKPIEEYYRQF